MTKRALVTLLAAAGCVVLAAPAQADRTQPLAQGPVMALPPGGSFLSVGYLPQPSGASFGPHGHVPGFVYALSDDVTTAGHGSTTVLEEGEGQFIPALAVHTHKNSDNRLQAGTLAIGLVVAVLVLVLVAVAGVPSSRVPLVPALLVLIIAGGALAFWNPWKNEWFFLGIRPEAARGAPMPLPSASRTYESPQFSNLGAGPYVESLATMTVDPRGEGTASTARGAVVFLVLDGRADVNVNETDRTRSSTRRSVRLGHHEAALVQKGDSYRVSNPTGSTLRLLRFALTPQSGAS